MVDAKRSRLLTIYRRGGFVFVHVPKTAGFALAHVLTAGVASEHASATELRDQIGVTEWQQLFSFAIVRHPLHRFLSAFWYLKRGGMNGSDRAWAKQNLAGYGNAEQFTARLAEDVAVLDSLHFRTQQSFVCDETGKIIVDFIGHFESLSKSLGIISEKIGRPLTISRLNVTPYYEERLDLWSSKSRSVVESAYSKDYELFSYKKGLLLRSAMPLEASGLHVQDTLERLEGRSL
jgi:hypothetical protein